VDAEAEVLMVARERYRNEVGGCRSDAEEGKEGTNEYTDQCNGCGEDELKGDSEFERETEDGEFVEGWRLRRERVMLWKLF